ncbi:hypothetical protein B9Z55_012538 [Caenorhabditis nigoni]|uniref:C6 domain-containing protein n=1 Tax=Caenorhabditis nigoni TaxID=1611254 RepID=A0A2G5TXP5_9PELO|nr:hypothetical protein B9Z55_012538 [Caenorhabditis nigoni]
MRLFTLFLVSIFVLNAAGSCGGATPKNCKSCQANDLNTGPTTDEYSKEFSSDKIDTSGDCAVRTLVCEATPDSNDIIITYKTIGSVDYSRWMPGMDEQVTEVLTCNDEGQWTASGEWTNKDSESFSANGTVLTEISCMS